MKLFELTRRDTRATDSAMDMGRFVDRTEKYIIESDVDSDNAAQVADTFAIKLIQLGWKIYWNTDETAFKATYEAARQVHYITVKEL